MKTDIFGNPIFQSQDLIDLLYKDRADLFDRVIVEKSEEMSKLSQATGINFNLEQDIAITVEEYDSICQNDWFIPDEYKNMDIEGYLVHVCPKENYQRLIDELTEFRARNMLPLLKVLKYVVDTLKEKKIFWGVGRGSSVASYVLYLLEVHKIDSIKYNLDWREFLR
jgi:DNA polymerase III alpha subunit